MSNVPPDDSEERKDKDRAEKDEEKTQEMDRTEEQSSEKSSKGRRRNITLSSAFRRLDPNNPVSEEKINLAIDGAWRRFNAYDKQATQLKKRYMQFRVFIIVASFFTTLLAVLETYTTDSSGIWGDILTISLVALPGLSAAVLTFAARFESGNAWVGFRGVSENIKRSIYELRIKRAITVVTQEDIDKLREVVKMSGQQLDDTGVNTPIFVDSINEQNPDDESLVKPNYVDLPEKDNGYAEIELEDYMKWRIYPQAEWYRKRAVRDYNMARIYRAAILVFSIVGPVLAATGYGRWVAVSVAMVTVLVAFLSLRQYEQNYGVYNRTARKLEDLVNDYRVKSDLMKPAEKLLWLNQIENVLSGEREVWQLSVLRGQAATEEALNQLVSDRTSILQDERRTVIGIIETDDEEDDNEEDNNRNRPVG